MDDKAKKYAKETVEIFQRQLEKMVQSKEALERELEVAFRAGEAYGVASANRIESATP